jgi:hypothetical protein
VALLEKAYAKLHGSYQSLISGYIDDGLADMTGLVSHKKKIQTAKSTYEMPKLAPDVGTEDKFWANLEEKLLGGTLFGCSIVGSSTEAHVNIDGEFCGLIAGHAYSLLDSATVTPKPDEDGGKTEPVRLVKIRNPWGSINPVEWNGKWSDGTTELLDNEEQINGLFKANA